MIDKILFEKLYGKIDSLNKRHVSPQRFYYSVKFNLKNCPLAGKRVLDLGCGSGTFSLYAALVANAQKVTALDAFEGFGAPALNYKLLLSLLKAYNLTDIITLIKANVLSYDFNEKPFDVIYCSYVLHHLFPKTELTDTATISKFLTKLRNLLSRRGIIIVQEVMRHNIAEYLPRRLALYNIDWKSKRNAFEWSELFHIVGFKHINIRYYIPFPFRHLPLKILTSNPLGSFFTLSRYIMECR